MKEIRAYIKPHKLSEVTLALHEVIGLTGLSVIDAHGCGRVRIKGPHETADDASDYKPCKRLEILCKEELVETIISTILEHAHTGLKGDGKIYVYEVTDAIRISTGESGIDAV